MVWPSASRAADFDRVHASYAGAAASTRVLLLPAGDAWRAAWRRDPGLALYGPDGFHPSPGGSYLAALTIFHTLTGQLPPPAAVDGISSRDLDILRAAAAGHGGR